MTVSCQLNISPAKVSKALIITANY